MDNLYVVLICAYSLKICHNIGEIMRGLLAVLKRIRIDHLRKGCDLIRCVSYNFF
jgi:hypothetical protein